MIEHFGWDSLRKPREFLLGRTVFDSDGAHDISHTEIDPELHQRLHAFDVGEQSEHPLEDWSEAANMLFAKGCEAQGFTLLASFAAPLMALWPDESGGSVLSIWGGHNSGCSTAMAAATSVWGDPHATRLKKPALSEFERLRSLPMMTETLAQRDPIAISTALLMFTAPTAHWASVMIASSRMPLVGIVGKFRGIELECEVPRALIRPKNADRLFERLVGCRGHAGRRYLETISYGRALEYCRVQLGSRVAEMRDEIGAKDDLLPAMRLIAACHVAGNVVRDLGLIEFDPQRITRWAIDEALKEPS